MPGELRDKGMGERWSPPVDGRWTLRADLYVDCTGLRAKLIGEVLQVPFTPCGDSLLTNRAVTFMTCRRIERSSNKSIARDSGVSQVPRACRMPVEIVEVPQKPSANRGNSQDDDLFAVRRPSLLGVGLNINVRPCDRLWCE
jgi:hypothetical protein